MSVDQSSTPVSPSATLFTLDNVAKRRLNALRKALLWVYAHRLAFDMTRWASPTKKSFCDFLRKKPGKQVPRELRCGTSACAAGWYVSLTSGTGLALKPDPDMPGGIVVCRYDDNPSSMNGVDIFKALSEHFHIPIWLAYALFYNELYSVRSYYNSDDEPSLELQRSSLEEVLTRLDYFLYYAPDNVAVEEFEKHDYHETSLYAEKYDATNYWRKHSIVERQAVVPHHVKHPDLLAIDEKREERKKARQKKTDVPQQ